MATTPGDNGNQPQAHTHASPPIILTPREAELILAHRQLLASRKYCKILVEYDNGNMRFGVWQPQVKWQ